MILGIVGHEAAKFTPENQALARKAIRDVILIYRPSLVVSGRCPLGGIDIWAIEEATKLGVETKEFVPEHHCWDGKYGFKARNLDIAKSDHVVCVSVRDYPLTYVGRRFPSCYHCKGRVEPHVKGGGCWTAWKCPSREWRII